MVVGEDGSLCSGYRRDAEEDLRDVDLCFMFV